MVCRSSWACSRSSSVVAHCDFQTSCLYLSSGVRVLLPVQCDDDDDTCENIYNQHAKTSTTSIGTRTRADLLSFPSLIVSKHYVRSGNYSRWHNAHICGLVVRALSGRPRRLQGTQSLAVGPGVLGPHGCVYSSCAYALQLLLWCFPGGLMGKLAAVAALRLELLQASFFEVWWSSWL